jgi:hypothetical protein
MRKIETKEDLEKKKKRNYILIGLLLILIMIFSTVGFSFLENKSKSDSSSKIVTFKGIKFQQYGGFWRPIIQGEEFYFQYLPNEAENISIRGLFDISSYSGKPVYFVDGDNSAKSEILQNINRYILRFQDACINSTGKNNEELNKSCDGLPIKKCESDNIIIFDESENSTKVWKDLNCVYISGDMIKASDMFVYKLLNLI